MIERKKKICKCGCGREGYIWSNGMLKDCHAMSKLKSVGYALKPIGGFRSNGKSFDGLKNSINNSKYYFPILISTNGFLVCEETGEGINFNIQKAIDGDAFNLLIEKSWCAHILPKRNFPTVATDKDNCIILSGMYSKNQSHAEFDSTWEKASKMKVANRAIAYIEGVMHKLTDREQGRATTILEILKKK